MNAVIERMRQAVERGTPCRWCGTTAIDCQIKYLESDEKIKCCVTCKLCGGAVAHS